MKPQILILILETRQLHLIIHIKLTTMYKYVLLPDTINSLLTN